jgi:hypothetical protein
MDEYKNSNRNMIIFFISLFWDFGGLAGGNFGWFLEFGNFMRDYLVNILKK